MEDRGFNYDATYQDVDDLEKTFCFECGDETENNNKYCKECLELLSEIKEAK